MRAVVSPYHLTTREPPAMAALLLASSVVTLLPAPAGGAAAAQAEAEHSPVYMDFVKSWRWSEALWRAGVVAGTENGDGAGGGPGADVAEAWRMIQEDPACAGARALMRRDLYDNEAEYLRAMALDVLRAGPDPAVSAPVALGLDRYAARHGRMVMRPDPTSVVQRAEASLAGRAMTIAVPVLLEADGESILRARAALAPQLDRLRASIDLALEALEGDGDLEAARARLRTAAGDYQEAFEAQLADVAAEVPEDEPRLVAGLVSLTLASFPADVALRATAAATSRLGGRSPRAASEHEVEGQLALRDPLSGARFASIVVRVISRGQGAAR